jgi:hypothetical protein
MIQIGPGSEIRRSSLWRSPHSSHVMVTRIASSNVAPACDAPSDPSVASAETHCNEFATRTDEQRLRDLDFLYFAGIVALVAL